MVKLYFDVQRRKPVTGDTIHLNKVRVGTSKDILVYIVNDTIARLENIKVSVEGGTPRGLSIRNIPNWLDANGSEQLKITWKPPLSLRRALSVKLMIEGDEVYYA